MKSPMRQAFEAWHGFEVCDEMDIQTSVAWDNWKIAWKAATEAEREACAKVCEAQAILQDDAFRHGMTPVDGDLADRCATYIRERSNGQS